MKSFRLQRYQPSVAVGPHAKGSLLTAKEKVCILNLYQSYINDGMNNWEAKEETAHRLQFGIKSVQSVIKEKLSEGFVANNVTNISRPNAYEKLEEEEVDQICDNFHTEMQDCNMKHLRQ